MFGRGAEGAAVALSVEEPDPLTDMEARDPVADLIDDTGAIAVGNHAGKFHRAITAGAAGDIGGVDAGGFQPGAKLAPAGHRRRHVTKAQHLSGSTGSFVPDGFHSGPLSFQFAFFRACPEMRRRRAEYSVR